MKPTSANPPAMEQPDVNRRDFLSTTAVVGAGLASGLVIPTVHGGTDETLRVGLVGCGGRGSGAALDAIKADKYTKLVALGDVFPDRLANAKENLKEKCGSQYTVTDEHCYSGFDAYKGVIAASDVVLLATPPHFRPLHFKAAIEAGKHTFVEKPVAVDAPGVRSVLQTAKLARERNLAVCSGFCYRYHNGVRELMKRVHGGEIGEIVAVQSNYNTHYLWKVDRTPAMTDMDYQLRNWLYYTWLSGDHNVEQHIHSLDKAAWAMNDYPVKAVGLGGRQVRIQPEWGNIFDHHAVVYEFANGVRCFAYCRQQDHTKPDDSDWVFGAKGTAHNRQFGDQAIEGANPWRYKPAGGKPDNAYRQEHKELFASIRAGKPINNGETMAKSTLMGIMGRMATYTGLEITWDMALNSKEDLTPPAYEFGTLPTPAVAMPGITKFV